MFSNFKPPVIKKVTVTVPKKANPATPKQFSQNGSTANNLKRAQSTPNLKPSSAGNRTLTPRPSPKPSSRVVSRNSTPPRRKAPVKRKIVSEYQKVEFDDESDEDDATTRKRTKLSHDLTPDPERKTWVTEDNLRSKTSKIIHGMDLVNNLTKKIPMFPGEEPATVALRYPSNSDPEKFILMKGRESESYDPVEDIIETIRQVCKYYLPPAQSRTATDDINGIPRRLRTAVMKKSQSNFLKVVEEYNTLIAAHLSDGTTLRSLQNTQSVPLDLVERVLSQCTSRTVSPHVALLRQYENGGNNVYGELLPRFIHQIFREMHLTSTSTFVDLGSGVGNVTLQAALETGAESWGIEMMPNPCKLARAQKREFASRCALWGIRPGAVRLLDGDFTRNNLITDTLPRADVILVNNKAFNPELNEQLMLHFLDLKEGARIFSLKSFVPSNWEIKESNMADPRCTLRVERREYFSESVSWTDGAGEYFVATKTNQMLNEFLERREKRARR